MSERQACLLLGRRSIRPLARWRSGRRWSCPARALVHLQAGLAARPLAERSRAARPEIQTGGDLGRGRIGRQSAGGSRRIGDRLGGKWRRQAWPGGLGEAGWRHRNRAAPMAALAGPGRPARRELGAGPAPGARGGQAARALCPVTVCPATRSRPHAAHDVLGAGADQDRRGGDGPGSDFQCERQAQPPRAVVPVVPAKMTERRGCPPGATGLAKEHTAALAACSRPRRTAASSLRRDERARGVARCLPRRPRRGARNAGHRRRDAHALRDPRRFRAPRSPPARRRRRHRAGWLTLDAVGAATSPRTASVSTAPD